jgi:hypothetical protein
LDASTLAVLFRETPIIEKLRLFLAVCEAVGAAAYPKNPAAGVTVTDPLDGATFTWNPPKRRKVPIGSGASGGRSGSSACGTATGRTSETKPEGAELR